MYKLSTGSLAAFSYVQIPNDAGDFSLIDRRVVSWLLPCPERDLFLRGLRAYLGFSQIGVDYVRPERMFGRSTNNLRKNIEWAKRGIFSFSDTPLNDPDARRWHPDADRDPPGHRRGGLRILSPDIVPPGVTTLLLFVLFFGSLNLFAVGIVGEYVAKIMDEVKARPP